MKKVVITGGAGFIGTLITKRLTEKGIEVYVVDRTESRIKHALVKSVIVDTANNKIDPTILDGAFGVINLAGAPIFGRFTEKYKKVIYDSRINTTKNLIESIKDCLVKPESLISASAIGFYGNRGDELLDEGSKPGNDFLAKVCIEWERAARDAEQLGVRTVCVRTAHVIGNGGILAVLKNLFKKHIGGYFGNGKQYMPWVSANDLVSIYIYALENKNMRGAYNSAAKSEPQKVFMKKIAKSLGAWPVWRIPKFFGWLIFLSFIESLTSSTNIDNEKIIGAGFIFKDTELEKLISNNVLY